ncbi:MAG: hypothetical protein RL117_383 [Verrucomicrobiota bacterium]|jgi:hypothetical protein
MKIFILALSVLMSSFTFAATYIVNNGGGATGTGIADSLFRAFRGNTSVGDSLGGTNGGTSGGPGIVAFGVFDSAFNFSNATSTTLVSSFTNLSPGTTTAFSSAGPAGTRGLFSLSLPNVAITGNSTFVDKNMYLLVGNGSTFATSTEFLVLMNTRTFLASDDSIPTDTTISFTTSNSTLKFGGNASDIRTTGADSNVTAGYITAAPIPETSTSLLAVLGVFGLLRRRR